MISRRNMLLATASAPLNTLSDKKREITERPFDLSLRRFTSRHVSVGSMSAINEMYADLWIARTHPNLLITSSEIFVSIWNGTEPLYRRDVMAKDEKDPKIKEILNNGYVAQRLNGGILCIDKYLKSNEMYFICTTDTTEKHNGVLSWDSWEGPKTEMQLVQERLAALEARA